MMMHRGAEHLPTAPERDCLLACCVPGVGTEVAALPGPRVSGEFGVGLHIWMTLHFFKSMTRAQITTLLSSRDSGEQLWSALAHRS